MKIMWMSNAPWVGSGYGAQTAYMLPILEGHGHEAACFAFWGLEGSPIEWNGYRIYPPLLDMYGNDAIRGHCRNWGADALFTLFDPFVIQPEAIEAIGWKWFPWIPIDSVGLPRGFHVLEHARLMWSMSDHGTQQLIEGGFDAERIFKIPHGVNCDLHQNRTEDQRKALRERHGLDPDCFLIGLIQNNKGGRKSISAQIRAFADFRERYNANAHLFMHVEPTQTLGGEDLDWEIERIGLKGQGVVHRTDIYHLRLGIAEETMSELYGCMDVLLQATAGEGFGIPIIEAQANGVPVIVNDCSAMPELVPDGDLICRNPTPFRAPHGGMQAWPNHEEIVEKLGWLYKQSWPTIERKRNEARTFAEQFAWDKVAQRYWKPALAMAQDVVTPSSFAPGGLSVDSGGSRRLGVLCGPAVEDEALGRLVEAAPCEVIVCPPDQVAWDLDGYVILDAYDHHVEDLARIRATAPYVVVWVGFEAGEVPKIHEEAKACIATSEKWRWSAEIEEVNMEEINLDFAFGGPAEVWEKVAKWLPLPT